MDPITEKTPPASEPPAAVPPAEGAPAAGAVDVNAALAKVDVPPKFKPIYDKAVLSGMRIMFDKSSHKMMEEQLSKEGPMDDKIAEGIVALMYMLWQQSNQTIPPQIIVPVTFTLTLKAFDFLQKSGDPEATKEVLGAAMEKATTGIMQKFGVQPDQIDQIAGQIKTKAGAAGDAGAPAEPGLLQSGGA